MNRMMIEEVSQASVSALIPDKRALPVLQSPTTGSESAKLTRTGAGARPDVPGVKAAEEKF